MEPGVTAAISGDDRPWMPPRVSAGLAWLLCGASLTLGLLGLVLESLNSHQITEVGVVGIALMAITFPLVGAVVAARRPRNPLGWIFCAIGICYGLTASGEAYGIYALRTAPGSLPRRVVDELARQLGVGAGTGLFMTLRCCCSPTGGCRRAGGGPWPGCPALRSPSSAGQEGPGPGPSAVWPCWSPTRRG